MTENEQKKLGKTLWGIANNLRGAMNADDFRDYMLSFLFLRYLSDNYEEAAKKELADDYPAINGHVTPLQRWYEENPDDIDDFEEMMRRRMHYVIHPEEESFQSTFKGLFSEINLDSEKLGKRYTDRNARLCSIITKIAEGLAEFAANKDTLGDAYEYLIGQFAAGGGKKAGEFYTPQQVSTILSEIVTLDSQDPSAGKKKHLESVFDFACGSGSLLLNVRNKLSEWGWQNIRPRKQYHHL